jgi:hypothetical protein
MTVGHGTAEYNGLLDGADHPGESDMRALSTRVTPSETARPRADHDASTPREAEPVHRTQQSHETRSIAVPRREMPR